MPFQQILLVEDDATLCRAIRRNLEVRGYTAQTANGVGDALAMIDVDVPDLVLLDIDLPDGSGWEVAREIRRRESGAKIIVLTALRPNERLVQELDCLGFLEKPFPMDSLIRDVEDALNPRPDQPVLQGEGEDP